MRARKVFNPLNTVNLSSNRLLTLPAVKGLKNYQWKLPLFALYHKSKIFRC